MRKIRRDGNMMCRNENECRKVCIGKRRNSEEGDKDECEKGEIIIGKKREK